MTRYRIKNQELWVLADLYAAPCGMVAHWFSRSGKHSFEPFTPILSPSPAETPSPNTPHDTAPSSKP